MIEKKLTPAGYKKVLKELDLLMSKGMSNINIEDLARIRELVLAVQEYQQNEMGIRPPSSLAGILEMKMKEKRMTHADLAKKLSVSDSRLSMIIAGVERPDVRFVKAIHDKLHVDGNLLLNVI